ncbi:MAG TPA: hypothetical protein PLB54_02165 [Nitrosomonas sp.]|nr:hypothetical protein [Nitrosomonas sp.]
MAIDDFSRELYADIFPDKTQHSAACFLIGTVIANALIRSTALTLTTAPNLKEPAIILLSQPARQHGIGQKFTHINRSQTNGKAEHVIRTLMEM